MVLIPEEVKGFFAGAGARGGCPWWVGGCCDEAPWGSLLEARGLHGEIGGMYSIEYAVPAAVRDPRRGGGEGGSRHVLVDGVFESSAHAGKSSLGPRHGGMESAGRSAVSPEFLEVVVGAVIPWDRRTPVGVRWWNRGVGAVDGSGVDGSGGGAVEPGREKTSLLIAGVRSSTRLARSAETSATAGKVVCPASTGARQREHPGGIWRARLLSPTPQNNFLSKGAIPWSRG